MAEAPVVMNGKANPAVPEKPVTNPAAPGPASVIEALCAGTPEPRAQKVCEAVGDLLRAVARLIEAAAGKNPNPGEAGTNPKP